MNASKSRMVVPMRLSVLIDVASCRFDPEGGRRPPKQLVHVTNNKVRNLVAIYILHRRREACTGDYGASGVLAIVRQESRVLEDKVRETRVASDSLQSGAGYLFARSVGKTMSLGS